MPQANLRLPNAKDFNLSKSARATISSLLSTLRARAPLFLSLLQDFAVSSDRRERTVRGARSGGGRRALGYRAAEGGERAQDFETLAQGCQRYTCLAHASAREKVKPDVWAGLLIRWCDAAMGASVLGTVLEFCGEKTVVLGGLISSLALQFCPKLPEAKLQAACGMMFDASHARWIGSAQTPLPFSGRAPERWWGGAGSRRGGAAGAALPLGPRLLQQTSADWRV